MSHIAEYASNLQGVNVDILNEALKRVAKESGRGVVQHIASYDEGPSVSSWQGKKIIGAVRTEDLPQGVGVIVGNDGSLHFACDLLWEAEKVTDCRPTDRRFAPLEQRSKEAFARLTAAITKHYKVAAAEVALTRLGFVADVKASGPIQGGHVVSMTRKRVGGG